MALPLQPSMFPDLDSAEFYRDDHLDEIAEEVMRRHGHVGGVGRLIPVVQAVENGEVRILFLLNGKPLSPGDDPGKHEVAGKCVKAPPIWHDITGYDVAIWIREAVWSRVDGHTRRALVLHELLHVEVTRDKDDQVKVGTRKHDVEDFVDVARHYGPVAGDGAGYVRAAAAFAGEPEPLHPTRPADDLMDRVMDRVVDEVNAGAMGPNVTAERVSRGRKAKATEPPADDDVEVTVETVVEVFETRDDVFGGLVRRGEALEQARARIERFDNAAFGTPAGQELLEALGDGRGAEVPWPAEIDQEPGA